MKSVIGQSGFATHVQRSRQPIPEVQLGGQSTITPQVGATSIICPFLFLRPPLPSILFLMSLSYDPITPGSRSLAKISATGAAQGEEWHLAGFPRPAMASRCRKDLASAQTREGDGTVATLSAWRWDGEKGELGGAPGSLPAATTERGFPASEPLPPATASTSSALFFAGPVQPAAALCFFYVWPLRIFAAL
jgi:hypothetical protein